MPLQQRALSFAALCLNDVQSLKQKYAFNNWNQPAVDELIKLKQEDCLDFISLDFREQIKAENVKWMDLSFYIYCEGREFNLALYQASSSADK